MTTNTNNEKVFLKLTHSNVNLIALSFVLIMLLMFLSLIVGIGISEQIPVLLLPGFIILILIVVSAYYIWEGLKHKKDYIEITENGVLWKYANEIETLSWDKIDSCNIEYRSHGKGAAYHFIITSSGDMLQDFNLNFYHYDLKKLAEAVNTAYKEHKKQTQETAENLMDYKEIKKASFKSIAIRIAIIIIIYLIIEFLKK